MKLVIRNLTRQYDKENVLNGLGYTFEQGKVYGLFGKHRSGKTTFFRCISGECSCNDGTVDIMDNGIAVKPTYNDIELTYDTPVLPEFMTGYEYIKYYYDVHKPESDRMPEDYLKLLNISENEKNELIRDYSENLKRQLCFVCNLIAGPFVILLDEPFRNSDEKTVKLVNDVIKELKDKHIIIIGTDTPSEVIDICDEAVVLQKGMMHGMSKDEFRSSMKSFEED